MADIGIKIKDLKNKVRGTILVAGDSEYDETRKIWNAMIDRRPAVIVRCTGVEDVQAAIAFARQHRLDISIRGGGHNIAGSAVTDGGLMIDMSTMKSIRVDAA